MGRPSLGMSFSGEEVPWWPRSAGQPGAGGRHQTGDMIVKRRQ